MFAAHHVNDYELSIVIAYLCAYIPQLLLSPNNILLKIIVIFRDSCHNCMQNQFAFNMQCLIFHWQCMSSKWSANDIDMTSSVLAKFGQLIVSTRHHTWCFFHIYISSNLMFSVYRSPVHQSLDPLSPHMEERQHNCSTSMHCVSDIQMNFNKFWDTVDFNANFFMSQTLYVMYNTPLLKLVSLNNLSLYFLSHFIHAIIFKSFGFPFRFLFSFSFDHWCLLTIALNTQITCIFLNLLFFEKNLNQPSKIHNDECYTSHTLVPVPKIKFILLKWNRIVE